jgi:hypothetical protein
MSDRVHKTGAGSVGQKRPGPAALFRKQDMKSCSRRAALFGLDWPALGLPRPPSTRELP